ncbi:hypothetical protein HOLleu_31656 [Holothuria leucospilota]|uniref:Uncharacterized protein n=1 Tax=Holothuria leucospilota TaxID=206669 RepID=A0A9Q1BGE9_HOLLE|nr:hypothetical protein HOLleu_31656 [Holothuria leucospilota]
MSTLSDYSGALSVHRSTTSPQVHYQTTQEHYQSTGLLPEYRSQEHYRPTGILSNYSGAIPDYYRTLYLFQGNIMDLRSTISLQAHSE